MITKNDISGERAKNGGVLGEEIFCPRANGFSCPPPQAAGNSSVQVSLLGFVD